MCFEWADCLKHTITQLASPFMDDVEIPKRVSVFLYILSTYLHRITLFHCVSLIILNNHGHSFTLFCLSSFFSGISLQLCIQSFISTFLMLICGYLVQHFVLCCVRIFISFHQMNFFTCITSQGKNESKSRNAQQRSISLI